MRVTSPEGGEDRVLYMAGHGACRAFPKCGGEMKIIAFVTDAKAIRKILVHIGAYAAPERAPPISPPQDRAGPTGPAPGPAPLPWEKTAAEYPDPDWTELRSPRGTQLDPPRPPGSRLPEAPHATPISPSPEGTIRRVARQKGARRWRHAEQGNLLVGARRGGRQGHRIGAGARAGAEVQGMDEGIDREGSGMW